MLSSEKIVSDYRRYILTTFKTDVPKINDRIHEVISSNSLSKGPYLSIAPNYLHSHQMMDLVPEKLSVGFNKIPESSLGKGIWLYKHQEDAIDNVVVRDRNLVLSTGTGSGKTKSFMIPILNYLLAEREAGTLGSGVRAMIVYPMNALANDQIDELRKMLLGTGITFGAYTGQTEDDDDAAREAYLDRYGEYPQENELVSRKKMEENPPNILITNYAMLERLIIMPEPKKIFGEGGDNHWKYIVLDEAHTYTGAKGSEVSMLLRRLKDIISRPEIRFILASATLGGMDENDKVAAFANELCDMAGSTCPFTADDVVRSQTVDLETTPGDEVPDSFFEGICKGIDEGDDKEDMEYLIIEYLDENYPDYEGEREDYKNRILQIVRSDPRVSELRNLLSDGARELSELAGKMEMDVDRLISFIRTISLASDENYKLFDSKYHMFIRGLYGLYCSLTDNPQVFLSNCEFSVNPETGVKEAVFNISTCYNCGKIYLVGRIDKHFIQGDATEDATRDSAFMTIPMESFHEGDYSEEEKRDNLFTLCLECKAAVRFGEQLPCNHHSQMMLFKVKDDKKICTCRNCGRTENRRGILRQLYLGYDSSTAVISSSLYGEMEDNADHRFLSFSDSRQNAAYFAPYLEGTHQNMILHAAMYQAICDNMDTLRERGMDLVRFHDYLQGIVTKNRIYSEEYMSGENSSSADAWLMLYMDFARYNSNKSFEYLGLVYYTYDYGSLMIRGLEDDAEEFVNQIIKIVRDKVAVDVPTEIANRYWTKNYSTSALQAVVTSKEAKDAQDKGITNTTYILTETLGRYIRTVTDEDPAEVIRKILRQLSKVKRGAGYRVSQEKITIRSKPYAYRCTRCHLQTPFNVKGYCYRCCTKTLERFDSSELDTENNSYAYNYVNAPLMHLRVKEHTAQLDHEKAEEYQKQFTKGAIDALSCSTTFEMGVNIGDLNVVLLRNVPPTPANYIQRVGRAGRSPESSAYSITYCRNSPHDAYYFDHPLDMIEGKVPVPRINCANVRIVLRHIFASALAFYWRSRDDCYHDRVGPFMDDFDNLRTYLRSRPEDLLAHLKASVPLEIQDHVAEDHNLDSTIDLENFGWVDELLDDDYGRLKNCYDEYNTIIGEIEDYFPEGSKTKDAILATVTCEETISYLSSHGIIPKYGFPSEIAEMKNKNFADAKLKTSLQRDMSLAIGDFAPGSQTVVDGNLLTSRYVKTMPSRKWPRYYYCECKNCHSATVKYATGSMEDFRKSLTTCGMCGHEFKNPFVKTFIVPKFGFYYEAKDDWNISNGKPVRTYSGEVFYKGNNTGKMEKYDVPGHEIYGAYGRDDELVIVNRNEYSICPICGYCPDIGQSPETHQDHKGKNCSGTLHPYHLGHVFRTDVFIIQIGDGSTDNHDEAESVLSAIMSAFVKLFSIDENEISGCLSLSNGKYTYVLYDNTPGGAGYVKKILADNGENVVKLLNAAFDIAKNCNCGNGTDLDCACYSCLLNYRNQRYHSKIKRSHVIKALARYEV